MSEKAACPRCDSYASQVYYDGCHEFCGWNCCVEYTIRAYGDVGHAELVTTTKPTPEQRDAVAALAGAGTTSVGVTVNGYGVERLSAWLDPDQPDPEPLSERKQKANLKALRDVRLANARAAIDRELGE